MPDWLIQYNGQAAYRQHLPPDWTMRLGDGRVAGVRCTRPALAPKPAASGSTARMART